MAVAVAMPMSVAQAEMGEADGMMTVMPACPNCVGVPVVRVMMIARSVGVVVLMVPMADGVIGNVVNDAVDREG